MKLAIATLVAFMAVSCIAGAAAEAADTGTNNNGASDADYPYNYNYNDEYDTDNSGINNNFQGSNYYQKPVSLYPGYNTDNSGSNNNLPSSNEKPSISSPGDVSVPRSNQAVYIENLLRTFFQALDKQVQGPGCSCSKNNVIPCKRTW